MQVEMLVDNSRIAGGPCGKQGVNVQASDRRDAVYHTHTARYSFSRHDPFMDSTKQQPAANTMFHSAPCHDRA